MWVQTLDFELEDPAKVIPPLSAEQYLSLLDEESGPFEGLDSSVSAPLLGLAAAIEKLVAHGASGQGFQDFKEIYCEKCDFSPAKSLDHAVFDGAYLAQANFSHLTLRDSSFVNADLGGADFFGADLTRADLRFEQQLSSYFENKRLMSGLPLLECAKLGGADLSGQALVLFEKDFSPVFGGLSYDIRLPLMTSVQMDSSTKLDNFTIITRTGFSDDYLKQHPAAFEATWDEPITIGYSSSAEFRRIQTDMFAIIDWHFNSSDLKYLGKDAYILQGFVDQPALKALSLYSQFANAVGALSAPNDSEAKVAQQWSNKATRAWAAMKPSSCGENLKAGDLLFNLGRHSASSPPG
jgi:uncharacterized protein YjbI with pentapeptide repeats